MTLSDAKKLGYGMILLHKKLINADGTPMRFKVNGAVKTWKRDKKRIRIPVKYGLYDCGEITNGTFEGGSYTINIHDVVKEMDKA